MGDAGFLVSCSPIRRPLTVHGSYLIGAMSLTQFSGPGLGGGRQGSWGTRATLHEPPRTLCVQAAQQGLATHHLPGLVNGQTLPSGSCFLGPWGRVPGLGAGLGALIQREPTLPA